MECKSSKSIVHKLVVGRKKGTGDPDFRKIKEHDSRLKMIVTNRDTGAGVVGKYGVEVSGADSERVFQGGVSKTDVLKTISDGGVGNRSSRSIYFEGADNHAEAGCHPGVLFVNRTNTKNLDSWEDMSLFVEDDEGGWGESVRGGVGRSGVCEEVVRSRALRDGDVDAVISIGLAGSCGGGVVDKSMGETCGGEDGLREPVEAGGDVGVVELSHTDCGGGGVDGG